MYDESGVGMKMESILSCIYVFIGCFAFCFVSNLRGKMMILAPLGGSMGWLVYLLCGNLNNPIFQSFVATLIISLYSEVIARNQKVPVTACLLISILPLVPGGGLYYTMEYCIRGNIPMFIEKAGYTFGTAGALALGILIVSSAVRLWYSIRYFAAKPFRKTP